MLLLGTDFQCNQLRSPPGEGFGVCFRWERAFFPLIQRWQCYIQRTAGIDSIYKVCRTSSFPKSCFTSPFYIGIYQLAVRYNHMVMAALHYGMMLSCAGKTFMVVFKAFGFLVLAADIVSGISTRRL